jgi:hypothetical protein
VIEQIGRIGGVLAVRYLPADSERRAVSSE